MRARTGRRPSGLLLLFFPFLLLGSAACGGDRPAEPVEVEIPEGAGVRQIGERLERAGLVSYPRIFALYVRVRGDEGALKAGRYRFDGEDGWGDIVSALSRGEVVTYALTVPEGFTAREIAPRIAELSGVPPDSVLSLLQDTALARELGVPGPTLEGYLFPETYRFSRGLPPRRIIGAMVDRYRAFWGPEERRLADSLDLDEREVVTLASIVEEEARHYEEGPVIAGVYLNRLERGMLLQADPTVQYALGERRERLLYRDIDSVASDPYNTYTQAGLPPGPIASPGESSLRAVLNPADVPYLFFVARPDGYHVFTETERQHINAKNRIRRELDRMERNAAGGSGSDGPGR